MLDLTDCACTGKSLPKLLRPAILSILSKVPVHGYRVTEELTKMDVFSNWPPDHTGVYRMLQVMEGEGLLASSWEHRRSDRPTRQYRLTTKGKACLSRWKRTLQEYRQAIDDLLNLLQ
jgi:PadR family transcriptional regulator